MLGGVGWGGGALHLVLPSVNKDYPEIEFTKVILTKVQDYLPLAMHNRGFDSDLIFLRFKS
jgi:hypothetical protein